MSSDRIERKRRSEFDTSDSSADEIPAVKVRRLDSEIGIGEKVSKALKNILNWITPEFLKKMAVNMSNSRSSLNIGGNRHQNQYPVDVEDDDDIEECEIVCDVAQNGTGAFSRSASSEVSKMDMQSKDNRYPTRTCTSWAIEGPESIEYDDICRYLERKRANGYPVGAREIRSKQNQRTFPQSTKPRGEFQVLLDKDADVEIIQEVFPAKQSSGPVRKARLLNETRGKPKSRSDIIRGSAARSPYSSRSYTADEVVRIQERNQYSLLLQKIFKQGPIYQPAYPKKDPQTSAIQVDLTEEDDNISRRSSRLKDEKVAQNMDDFLRKFYEPYEDPHIVKLRSQTNSSLDDDDEVQIIEYPDIPTLRPRKFPPKNYSIFSNQWIEEMRVNIQNQTERILDRVLSNEERLERLRKRREAKEAEEKKKIEEMRLAGFVFPESVDVGEEVLPEITPEMDSRIENTLRLKVETLVSQVQTSREKIDIKVIDLLSLTGVSWLNDTVMASYFGLIEQRSKLDGYTSIYCLSTYLYSLYKAEGFHKIKRWTRKVDILGYDILFVPLHLMMHWALIVVDNRTKVIAYYDSMGLTDEKWKEHIIDYFVQERRFNKRPEFDIDSYTYEIAKNIPMQLNGYDCGMFALKYAEYLSRNAPLTFKQENMPYFRRRMIYELLTHQIL